MLEIDDVPADDDQFRLKFHEPFQCESVVIQTILAGEMQIRQMANRQAVSGRYRSRQSERLAGNLQVCPLIQRQPRPPDRRAVGRRTLWQ